MKVHQNLTNLHNFTLKERLKNNNKDNSFFTVKKAPAGSHINSRGDQVQNLKITKKRKSSIEDEREPVRKIKINPLRVRGDVRKFPLHARDQDTEMLEQTIQIDSSRLEVDNSIINIYRKMEVTSSDSKNRSALRSSSGSPNRRSLSGSRPKDQRTLPLSQLSPPSRGSSKAYKSHERNGKEERS